MTRKILIYLILAVFIFTKPAFSQLDNTKTHKIFNTGRAIGETYFSLIDIYQSHGVSEIKYSKSKYQHAFQNLSIVDLITEDLNLSTQSVSLIKDIRKNLYLSLTDEKINFAQLDETIQFLGQFYNSFEADLETNYGTEADWYADLGFYSAFQLEALNTAHKDTLMLQDNQNIYSQKPQNINPTVSTMIDNLSRYNKPSLTTAETKAFQEDLKVLVNYFSVSPDCKTKIDDVALLKGYWQGVMINPYGQKYNIKMNFKDINDANLFIQGIAENIPLENVDIIDNYFSFTFKPVGTEKFNVRFNAKINEDIFSGNITNSLNEEGYWVLTKTAGQSPLSDEKLNSLKTYLPN